MMCQVKQFLLSTAGLLLFLGGVMLMFYSTEMTCGTHGTLVPGLLLVLGLLTSCVGGVLLLFATDNSMWEGK